MKITKCKLSKLKGREIEWKERPLNIRKIQSQIIESICNNKKGKIKWLMK
jgi:hypothetical protein